MHCLIACHFHRWFQSAHCDLKGPRVPSLILCLETSTLLLKQTLNSLWTNSQCEPSADNSKPKSNLLLDGFSNKRTERSNTKYNLRALLGSPSKTLKSEYSTHPVWKILLFLLNSLNNLWANMDDNSKSHQML